MTKQTYDITAWCDRRFFACMSMEAETPEQALSLARKQVDDAPAEECDSCWDWDRFRVEDASGNAVLDHEDEHVRVASAGKPMLDALRAILPYAEAELASLRACQRRDGGLANEITEAEERIKQAWTAVEMAEGSAG